MTYVAWAALYEGTTDKQYFDILIPRIMEELVRSRGTRNVTVPPQPAIDFRRQSNDKVAEEICRNGDAYHLVFIHADTGGRALEGNLDARSIAICEAAHSICNWPPERCIKVSPRHELEAWALADSRAVCDSLGYSGTPASIGLPADPAAAERLVDPKAVLLEAVKQVRGTRRPISTSQVLPTIAQRQDLAELRRLAQFRNLESSIADGLRSLGAIA